MSYVHNDPDDDPLDGLELHSLQPAMEYGTDGWILSLLVSDDATLRLALDKWAPK